MQERIPSDEVIIKGEEEVFQVIVKLMENGNREDLGRVPKIPVQNRMEQKISGNSFRKFRQPLEVVVLSGNVEIPEIFRSI